MIDDDEEDSGPEELTAPGWMATYGDLMSLLLVFFILLVSFSTMEVVKFRQAMGSLKGGESFFEPNSATSIIKRPSTTTMSGDEFLDAIQEMAQDLAQDDLDDNVEVFWDGKGIRFVLQDEVLFTPGTAKLRPQFFRVIDSVLGVLKTFPVEELRIEGHTDNTPIRNERYPSNWELSVDRATSVLRYIESKSLYDARRLVAVGFGEFRPTVPNDSAANKTKNRRVEIYAAKKPGS